MDVNLPESLDRVLLNYTAAVVGIGKPPACLDTHRRVLERLTSTSAIAISCFHHLRTPFLDSLDTITVPQRMANERLASFC